MKKKSILLGVVATTIAIGLVAAVVIFHFGFQQHFEVVSGATLRIFYDAGLTNELQQGQTLDWGQITDSSPKTKTLYIEDVGTADATLELGYDPNQPPWNQGWSLSWDYIDGTVVVHGPHNSGHSITVILTLTLPETLNAGSWTCGSEIRATPVS
jgi:hypothetical protein